MFNTHTHTHTVRKSYIRPVNTTVYASHTKR